MDPEKLYDMTRQMRRNNEDIADFLKDMNQWEADMKTKESEIKAKKPSDSNQVHLLIRVFTICQCFYCFIFLMF